MSALPPAAKRNYGWVYFFVFLLVASVGVAGFMAWFNLHIQLKPEQLAPARKLWEEKGPKNYDMVYTKQINLDPHVDKFFVKVRAGKVEEVLMNGKPLERSPEAAPGEDPRIYHSMDAQLAYVARFMDIDRKAGAPQVYVTADFDESTGAMRRYIRSVRGTKERVEMHLKVDEVSN